MSTADNPNVKVVFVDPDDDGFYKSRTRQWATLCPHINHTEYRVYTITLDLCSERNHFRKVTLAEIAALLPSGKKAPDGTPKPASVSTVANAINALADIGQITDPNGNPIRVSNKTKGDLRLAPWRSLQHECSASRNVYDALARIRGLDGDDGPRWPTGLGTPAQNSVPGETPAQNSVPPAQDSVPPTQNSVPPQVKAPIPTSVNRDTSISPSRSSSSTPTHTSATESTGAAEPEAETRVCEFSEHEINQMKGIIYAAVVERATGAVEDASHAQLYDLLDHAKQCWALNIDTDTIEDALNRRINDKTEYPYRVARGQLKTLISRTKEPSFVPGPRGKKGATNSWVDDEGFEWPHFAPYARACGGQSCSDYQGKRYVAYEERRVSRDGDEIGSVGKVVRGEAFSCPVCRKAYKKEAAAA